MKENGFAPILILVAALVVGVLVGGVYYWQKSQALQLEPTTPPILTPTKQPVNLPQVDETANWKTYSNKIYGFEIKYPPSLILESGKYSRDNYWIIRLIDPLLKEKDCISSYIYDCIGFDITFTVTTNKTITDFNNMLQTDFGSFEVEDLTSSSGIKFKKVTNESPSGAYYWLLVFHNDKIYLIIPSRGNEGSVNKNKTQLSKDLVLFNQILSTFKFTNEITDNQEYYTQLIQDCNEKQSKECCLSSVENMEKGSFKIMPREGCPKGTQKNTLRCIDSYQWCEPQKSE